MREHNECQPGPAAPSEPSSEPDSAAIAAQVVTVATEHKAVEPAQTQVQRGAPTRLEFEHTAALPHDVTIDDGPIGDLRVGGRA
jgi:plastocyanin